MYVNVRGLGFRGRLCLALYLVFAAFLSGCAQLQTKPGLPAIGGEPGAQAQPGKFVFHELLNDDPARAQAFYGELFGWQFQDQGDGYSLIEADGRPIGGLVQHQPEDPARSENQWLSTLSVADVDAAVALVRERGGVLLEGPQTLPPRGRLAIVTDPQGALLVLLRADGGDPPDSDPAPGRWLWDELWTRDPKAAQGFYQGLAGYRAAALGESTGDWYLVLGTGERPRAGIVQLPWPELTPSWLPYLRVSDVPAVIRRATELGGSLLLVPAASVESGQVAILADPTGAVFGIQQPLVSGRVMP
jgi:predicted enzyme related to lactoylglutathione lyase